MARLFVSYRRSDADSDAGRIADRLVEEFGEESVFHDHEALKVGIPWEDQIDAALARTDVTLVVIGPGWLSAALPDGTRRLDDPKDMVAYEIAQSIERGIRIVPILVRDASLPDASALPARLRKLPKYQGRRVRNDTFGPDMEALIASLEGSRRFRGRRLAWVGGSVAAGVVALVVAGAMSGRFKPPKGDPEALLSANPPAAGPEVRAGELSLRIHLARVSDAEATESQRFLLSILEPVQFPKVPLPEPRGLDGGVVEVVAQDTLLPGRGERYAADVRRQPLSARVDDSPNHGRMSLCLVRTDKAPPTALRALLDCEEGERCTLAKDNPGHFQLCGKHVGLDIPGWPWISTAHAQAAPVAASVAWVVPSLETLQRQREAGTGPAFTEVQLTSPPLPALSKAQRVSVQVTVNGREALIDGFPPDASAVPFDPAQGVRLSFALENLDFAGANRGHEDVEIAVRFLGAQGLVRESRAALKYIALRDHSETTSIGEPDIGLQWSAKFYPGRSEDRFQIFVTSSENIDALVRTKQALDAAKFSVSIDGRTYPLVGVVRPPLGSNKAWGLNVGTLQPSGQVRFTFDERVSAEVCGRVAELASNNNSVLRKDSYRRSVDGTQQYSHCTQFLPR